MGDSTIEYMRSVNAALYAVYAAHNFGYHAAGYNSAINKPVDLVDVDMR